MLRRDVEQSLGGASVRADTDALLPLPVADERHRSCFGVVGAFVSLSALAAAAVRWAPVQTAWPAPLDAAAVSVEEELARWVDNGTGCSNWQDISMGGYSVEASLDACGERCAATMGCVLFNYQAECDGYPGRGACYAFRGACRDKVDGCWKLFAMRSSGPAGAAGAAPTAGAAVPPAVAGGGVARPAAAPAVGAPGAGNVGGTGEASADGEGVSAIPSGSLELSAVLDLERGMGFERVEQPRRCALVGSSSVLLGKAAGDEIDTYDTVIRMNRLPRGRDIQRDVGNKTDVFFIDTMHPWREDVEILMQKMGAHPPRASCRGLDNCRNASLILKKSTCRLQKLAEAWGGGHPFIACNRPRIASIAESFSQIRGHFPSTGFVAFLTFLPICQELDLFGFGGYATADGHSEWSGHDLGAEHDIEDAIAAGKQPPWSNPHDPDALDWLLAHAAKVQNRR